MNCFKIETIEYGWFECRIGKYYIEASDFLGYDISKEFLSKLNRVLNESSREWIYIMNEPGVAIIELQQGEKAITINIYSMNKESDELSPDIESELKNIGERDFSIAIKKSELVDAVVLEYSLYENGNGRKCYEKNWGDYPQNEYNELKRIAFEINKTLDEYHSLKCVEFL